jgi:hypothetical protein
MNAKSYDVEKRRLAAAAIEVAIRDLSKQRDMRITSCAWHIDQATCHAGPHRLDIVIDDTSASIYFCDRELLEYGDDYSSYITDSRLAQFMDELQGIGLSVPLKVMVSQMAAGMRP